MGGGGGSGGGGVCIPTTVHMIGGLICRVSNSRNGHVACLSAIFMPHVASKMLSCRISD